MAQLKGIVAVAVYTLVVSLAFWFVVKAVMGLRVSKEEEIERSRSGRARRRGVRHLFAAHAGDESRSRLRVFLN